MGIQVKQMTAADPGVGFILEISDEAEMSLNEDLSVIVVVKEPALKAEGSNPAVPEKQHRFNLTISKPLVLNDDLVFVLPYCSSTYNRETTVDVRITVAQGSNVLKNEYHNSVDAHVSQKFKIELE